MHIFDYDLHDHDQDWEPEDRSDFEFWMNVNVGDGTAGNYYQVHVCTPVSIKRIEDKKGCFMIDEWIDTQSLLSRMNAFIKQTVAGTTDDPYRALGKYWQWEYEVM